MTGPTANPANAGIPAHRTADAQNETPGQAGRTSTTSSRLRTSAGARLHYRDVGEGPVVLALHGAYSTHEEIRGFLDPVLPRHRRIYPDLPGMGDSTADGIHGSAGAVTALAELVDHEVGDAPFVVVAHSFGAHLARGLAARRPHQVRGLALICPQVMDDLHPEQHIVLSHDGAADGLSPELAAEFTGYFVVHTTETVDRFREAVVPALGRYDAAAVERVMTSWRHDPDPAGVPYDKPVLVLTGRHDSVVGYRQHQGLLEAYPRATSLVLAGAGHALPHEHPAVLADALRHWLERVR